MKKFTLTCVAVVSIFAAQAQTYQRCGIYYDYDAAGNRVKRYYDCKMFDPNNPYPDAGTNPPGGSSARMLGANEAAATQNNASLITIYPNPANDFVNIKLNEAAPHTHFHLYDGKGSIVLAGDISGQEYRCNLAAVAPGLYHLNILYKGKPYRFKLTKL